MSLLRFRRIIDLLLLVGLLFAVHRLWTFNLDPGWEALTTPPLAVSERLDIPGVEWSRARRTLVIAMATTCSACEGGLPDYKRLESESGTLGIPLVVVGSERADRLRLWLAAASIRPSAVLSLQDLREKGISIVPTIMVVDSYGVISDLVAHAPSPLQFEQLRRRLADPSTAPINEPAQPWLATRAELEQKVAQPGTLIADLRSREEFSQGHRTGAINIPLDEVMGRTAEIAHAANIFVDCGRAQSAHCAKAIATVRAAVSVPVAGIR